MDPLVWAFTDLMLHGFGAIEQLPCSTAWIGRSSLLTNDPTTACLAIFHGKFTVPCIRQAWNILSEAGGGGVIT